MFVFGLNILYLAFLLSISVYALFFIFYSVVCVSFLLSGCFLVVFLQNFSFSFYESACHNNAQQTGAHSFMNSAIPEHITFPGILHKYCETSQVESRIIILLFNSSIVISVIISLCWSKPINVV